LANTIHHDQKRAEAEGFEQLKAELQRAFSASDDSYETLDADTVLKRGRTAPNS
jgi:hypothetical protein